MNYKVRSGNLQRRERLSWLQGDAAPVPHSNASALQGMPDKVKQALN
jgi:hypothetical protein